MKNKHLLPMIQLAMLTAIVVIFQLMGTVIKFGATSISLVLIPITLGAILLGAKGGAFLGFVFGAITLWAGISGADIFTATLFQAQPVATAIICLGKGVFAGLLAGLVAGICKKKDRTGVNPLGTILAAITLPIVNTGLFILGGLTLVADTLQKSGFLQGNTLIYFLVIGCAGFNFIFEFLLNLVVSPAIGTIVKVVTKRLGMREGH